MTSLFSKFIRGVAGLSLALSAVGLGPTAPSVQANSGLNLPGHLELVDGAGGQVWDVKPGTLVNGTIQLIVHINKASLAMVGRNWSHAQRVAYVAEIRAAQDAVAAQVEAAGGRIVGRFAHLSAGLAVTIDADRVESLRGISNVVGVRGIADYTLDLSETVGWIGAAAVQTAGVTGDGVDVAVIDSGVDYTHIKLGGTGSLADYAACYSNPDSLADCALYPNAKVAGGWDWVGEDWPTFGPQYNDPDPIDFEGHGTHVADIIAGFDSDAGDGISDQGVAPGARIWAFKACSAVSSSCNGLALLLALDDAMDLDDSDYGVCEPGVDPGCLAYDPADVINMSLGSIYGQPEDDLTLFSDIASYYGSLVVASAGNSADKPYIVGSPSAAAGAISVAQSTVPSDGVYVVTAGSVSAGGVLQPWSPAIAGPISGTLQYGNGAGGNLNGCAAFPAGSLTGKVLLVDRGVCAVSIKGANGSAAGALLVLVANNAVGNTPPSFSYGGGIITVPVLTLTKAEGALLKTVLGQVASTSPASFTLLQDDIVASSSRGPRIADGDIKPDIAAPGASVSAEVGTGTGKTAFGGTSGAAPMVSGAAALLIEKLENAGLLNSDPGLDGPISFSPVVKSILMNNAKKDTFIGGSFLAPITLQGAGRVDILKAVNADSVVWDATDFFALDPTALPCNVYPVTDVFLFILFGFPPECAIDFPFGNSLFNAWNAQTGSVSFGYDGYAANGSETRKLVVLNFGTSPRTYKFSTEFRYADDKATNSVTVKATPSSVTVAPGALKVVNVQLSVKAQNLPPWTLSNINGDLGTNIFCNNPNPENGCPTLTMFEQDGFLKVDAVGGEIMRLPWQVLPKRAARTHVTSVSGSSVKLKNTSNHTNGDVDVFALIEKSANNCEIVSGSGDCIEDNYVPGILPGVNNTAIDINEVGVRSYVVPGINGALGFPAEPGGTINDLVVDFGLTVYDAPYRASHNFPIEFDIYVDGNADGVDDYVIFNYDVALTGGDGRNAVFVADINPSDGTRPLRPYFYSNTDFNSQNWILPVPAAAVGINSHRTFKFFVLAFDAYFTGSLWDCSPSSCGGYHTFNFSNPRVFTSAFAPQVPKNKSISVGYSKRPVSVSTQAGLLFMYRASPVGEESDSVIIP